MLCLSRRYPFKFFKGCLPQILLGPFLNTLSRIKFVDKSSGIPPITAGNPKSPRFQHCQKNNRRISKLISKLLIIIIKIINIKNQTNLNINTYDFPQVTAKENY